MPHENGRVAQTVFWCTVACGVAPCGRVRKYRKSR
jgi:hypothetical protein